jgi:preprotein translocase subunit SecD
VSGFRNRALWVTALVVVLGYLAVANLVPRATREASPLLPDQGIRLGLDLQGGIHWVLGAQLDAAEKRELEFMSDALDSHLKEEKVEFAAVRVQGDRVEVEGGDAAQQAARTWIEDRGFFDLRSTAPVAFALGAERKQEIRQQSMDQVLEVLRTRIDDPDQGIPESVVTRQGDTSVLVQIPGGQVERTRARELLKATGFLEFKIVKDAAQTLDALKAKYPNGLPAGDVVVYERDKETGRELVAYLVAEKADLTGDFLTDARVGFDNLRRPLVTFRLSPEGGELFEKITSAHRGERLAIILDQRVHSAPTLQSTIRTDGQITGQFTPREAADLATVLRSGSLSVPVVIEEERTVGPALGQDSIDSGIWASVVSLALIVAFCLVYYRFSGTYAAAALLINMLLLVGLLSLFRATLTLPGLAGIVLTIGMAVDANVIVFERIRDELRTGKTPRAAIGTGYDRAFWTIVDANLTTLITALVLYQYGTGPIKGFGVTLAVGIVTSVFSALVITRLFFQYYPGNRPVESLSI